MLAWLYFISDLLLQWWVLIPCNAHTGLVRCFFFLKSWDSAISPRCDLFATHLIQWMLLIKRLLRILLMWNIFRSSLHLHIFLSLRWWILAPTFIGSTVNLLLPGDLLFSAFPFSFLLELLQSLLLLLLFILFLDTLVVKVLSLEHLIYLCWLRSSLGLSAHTLTDIILFLIFLLLLLFGRIIFGYCLPRSLFLEFPALP